MATRILRATTSIHPSTFTITSHHFFSTNQSNYRTQISLANLLRSHGFPPSHLEAFLSKNHALFTSNPYHHLQASMNILLSFKIPQKSLISLISDCPGVLELGFLRKWEVELAKVGNLGVSPLVIKNVLEVSRRFGIDPDGFYKGLRVLNALGFSERTVRKVLEGFPEGLLMKESEIRRRIDFLMELGVSRDEVDWVFRLFPEILGHGAANRLRLLVDEFQDLGFSKELVKKEIVREPRILGMESGELSRCLELLRSLKCREPIKWKIFGDGAFRAGFEVKLRVDCLCKHGLIRREAFKVLWKEPRAIIYDIEEIDKKIYFLVNTMGFNVGCLVEVPEFLGVSFEKQILPRYKVIRFLLAKGGIGDEVTLKCIIKLSRLRFYNMYVKPYPECEKMFGRFSGDTQDRSRHPVGLWKLFRAQRDPESREDVNNMKSFMGGLV